MNIIDSVKEKGIFKFEKFINNIDLKEIDQILNKYKHLKATDSSFIYRSRKNFLLKKLLNFELSDFKNALKFLNLSKKMKLKEISSEIIGKKTKLAFIDAYFSNIQKEKIIDWHVDQAYSGKLNVTDFENPDHAAIKFFVYMTDVSKKNGCLGYIQESHKILYYLKLGIFKGDLKYIPYWKLDDLRKVIQNEKYRTYLKKKIDDKIIDNFLEQTKFIKTDPYDTNLFDFDCKKGDALVFDESGVHRGAETSLTNRLVLRFAFKANNAPD